jgi:hypothetical protein
MPLTIPATRLPRARTKGSIPIVPQMLRLRHLQTLQTLLSLIRGPNRGTNRNPKISGPNGRERFGQLLPRATPRIQLTSILSLNRGTNRRPRISTVSRIRSVQDTTSRSLNLGNRKKKRRTRNLQSLRRKTSLRRTTNSLFFGSDLGRVARQTACAPLVLFAPPNSRSGVKLSTHLA